MIFFGTFPAPEQAEEFPNEDQGREKYRCSRLKKHASRSCVNIHVSPPVWMSCSRFGIRCRTGKL